MHFRSILFLPLFLAYSVMVAHAAIPHHHHLTHEEAVSHHSHENDHVPTDGGSHSEQHHPTHFVHQNPSDHFRCDRQGFLWPVSGLESWILSMVSTWVEAIIPSGNAVCINHPPEYLLKSLANHFLPGWKFRGPPVCIQ